MKWPFSRKPKEPLIVKAEEMSQRRLKAADRALQVLDCATTRADKKLNDLVERDDVRRD